ncbi:uncharacterized protein LOC103506659 [Caligus rogercresseyi]|uniref:Uncharacterized protein LOC103506659 n=1 Tax=Caligus rogercresseyi TaxID=217165 RepID=A0A7T8KFB4_CALRO|nr:uncharacterized protein LOC103506659 [Caligus rogercresseyi]
MEQLGVQLDTRVHSTRLKQRLLSQCPWYRNCNQKTNYGCIRNRRSFRYLAAHEMAAGLGPEKARALPMFLALTGCNTVSSFARHGKKTAWAV